MAGQKSPRYAPTPVQTIVLGTAAKPLPRESMHPNETFHIFRDPYRSSERDIVIEPDTSLLTELARLLGIKREGRFTPGGFPSPAQRTHDIEIRNETLPSGLNAPSYSMFGTRAQRQQQIFGGARPRVLRVPAGGLGTGPAGYYGNDGLEELSGPERDAFLNQFFEAEDTWQRERLLERLIDNPFERVDLREELLRRDRQQRRMPKK